MLWHLPVIYICEPREPNIVVTISILRSLEAAVWITMVCVFDLFEETDDHELYLGWALVNDTTGARLNWSQQWSPKLLLLVAVTRPVAPKLFCTTFPINLTFVNCAEIASFTCKRSGLRGLSSGPPKSTWAAWMATNVINCDPGD